MSNFQIAVYQNFSPPPFNYIAPSFALNPFLQSYGSAYLNYYSIYEPRNVTHTPPQRIGTDSRGFPSVRGYAQMQWQYVDLKPENWYFLYYLWRLAQLPAGPQTGAVRIQWPNPTTETNVNISARWDSIATMDRDMPQYHDVTLTFSHLGIDDPPGTAVGTWVVG